MQVLRVWASHRHMPGTTPDDRPGRVRDGQGQRKDRDHERESDRHLGHTEDGDHTQRRAQEMRARVAHEDPSGVEVEQQEAEATAGERASELDDVDLVPAGSRDEQG
jgi:hypothetical protein